MKFSEYKYDILTNNGVLTEQLIKGRKTYYHGGKNASFDKTGKMGDYELFYFTSYFGYALKAALYPEIILYPKEDFSYRTNELADNLPYETKGTYLIDSQNLKYPLNKFYIKPFIKDNSKIRVNSLNVEGYIHALRIGGHTNIFEIKNHKDRNNFINTLQKSKYNSQITDSYDSPEFEEKIKNLVRLDWASKEFAVNFYGLGRNELYDIIFSTGEYVGVSHNEIDGRKKLYSTIGIFKDRLSKFKVETMKVELDKETLTINIKS